MSEFTAAPIGCLIMAAGNASRFGENKLTASFAGKSLFSLALAAIPADTFARVTVVSQYPALLQEAEQAGFHAIRNDRPDDGISRTICDYIAGMTDRYAVYKYSELFIPATWQVR